MAYRPKGFAGVGQLMITKNVFYGSDSDSAADDAVTPDLLAPGSIGIYATRGNAESAAGVVSDGELIVSTFTAANIEGVNQFYFALGTANGTVVSQVFDRRNFSWRYRDAAAAVKQKTIAEVKISASPSDDDNYRITIVDTTEGRDDLFRKSFDFLGSELSASTTAAVVSKFASIITAYIASPKAHDDFPIETAVNTSNELVLTAKTGCSFRVALDGISAGEPIVYSGSSTAGTASAQYNPGSGTIAQVTQIEKDLSAASGGYLNQVMNYGRIPVSLVDTALADPAYDLITLRWINQRVSTDRPQSIELMPHDLIIAHGASFTTGAGEIQDVLKALLAILDYSN